jgi:hypothetical protein
MGEQEINHDAPIGKTWSDDWAAAEKKADAYEERNSGDDNEENEQRGSEEREGGDEASGDEESSSSGEEAQLGEEPDGDGLDERGERDVSREGRVQRGDEEVKSRADRLKALRVEAAALGLEYEGNAVTVADRARLREEKRNLKARLAEDRAAFEEEAAETTSRLQARVTKASKLEAAIEANDLDAIAQAMGVQSWNHLSEQALKRQLNPEHKELMRLRKEQRDGEENRKAQEKAYKEHEANQRHHEQRQNYQREIVTALHQQKKYKAFADDPLFISGIMKHQEANWDGEETLSLEEAAELALKDARFIYDKLHAKFGPRTASQSEQSASGTSAEKQGRRAPPKTVSQSEVADASGTDRSGDFDQDAWLKKWSPKIKNSETQT